MIQLPNNWDNVTCGQLKRILDVWDTSDNNITIAVETIHILTGVEKHELLKLDFNKEFKPLMLQLEWMQTTPLPFLPKPIVPKKGVLNKLLEHVRLRRAYPK